MIRETTERMFLCTGFVGGTPLSASVEGEVLAKRPDLFVKFSRWGAQSRLLLTCDPFVERGKQATLARALGYCTHLFCRKKQV